MKIKFRSSVTAIIAFASIFIGLLYWIQLSQTIEENDHKRLVRDVLIAESSAIERRLSRTLSATYILAQEVIRTGGEFPEFESYASGVMDLIEGISNLQLAPNGIITKIYPLAGNEGAIGHNILRDDMRREEAKLAVQKKRLTLAGPFSLIQGDVAIIGRNPVFLNRSGGVEFWGFVSVLMYLDDLMSVTNLANLEAKEYSFQLSRIHPDTGAVDIFLNSKADLIEGQVLTQKISVPNANWTLKMSRQHQANPLFGYVISFSIALALSYLLYGLLLQPEKLRLKVEEKTAQLKELAFYDPLTKLANRRLLNEQIGHEIQSNLREKKKTVLMYIDLDDFKRINDTLGHESGDQLLQTIASRLVDTLRKSDIVARLGGDEFALLLLNAGSLDQVQRLADKLIRVIRKPMLLKNSELIVNASIGITIIPDDGQDVSTLLSNSDLAMYAAKRNGKGKSHFFDKTMQETASQNLLLEQDLRKALENDEFFLVYQPLICFADEKVKGFEALIRWQHPKLGPLPPSEFIPIAETMGVVVPMGYWVLQKSCQLINHRKQQGLPPLYIAINLAAQQFSDPDIVSKVHNILTELDIDPELIELEITETALMDNFDVAIEALVQLRKLGISIAIDDFGTGYSSLSHLKILPADKLKIDRSFIMGVAETGSGDQKIVETILVMASKLQLKVVAEGIETHDQLIFLQKNGCDFGQGYLFDKPVPENNTDCYPTDLASILKSNKISTIAH